jgi:hypothetical protein
MALIFGKTNKILLFYLQLSSFTYKFGLLSQATVFLSVIIKRHNCYTYYETSITPYSPSGGFKKLN